MRQWMWGILVVGLLGGGLIVGGFVYPLSEQDHRGADQRFEIPDNESYELDAAIVVDDEPVLVIEGAQTPSGEQYARIRESESIVERYQAGRNDTTYSRYIVPEEQADVREQVLRDASDEKIAFTETDSERRVIVTKQPGDEKAEWDVRNPASVVTTELRLATYDSAGTTRSGEQRILKPQPGWYNGSRSYRLTNVNGVVKVASHSPVIYNATVEWDETHGTRSYIHYLVNRRAAITKEITIRYQGESGEIQTPDWVSRATGSTET